MRETRACARTRSALASLRNYLHTLGPTRRTRWRRTLEIVELSPHDDALLRPPARASTVAQDHWETPERVHDCPACMRGYACIGARAMHSIDRLSIPFAPTGAKPILLGPPLRTCLCVCVALLC
jgi:hypothetical protein